MKLNVLEKSILVEIRDSNIAEYPSLTSHYKRLDVLSRDLTGVGMFVNFAYLPDGDIIEEQKLIDGVISANKTIEIKALKYGLGFALFIEDGKIKMLELFTYDSEEWDGNFDGFYFVGI